jgi:hypothetical protein
MGRRRPVSHGVFLAVLLLLRGSSASENPATNVAWRSLQPGVEYAALNLGSQSPYGDNRLHVVRIDPRDARIEAVLAKELDGRPRTTAEWCKDTALSVAINIGMFAQDGLSHVGYLRHRGRTHSSRWVDYKSVLAFHPTKHDLPPVALMDLDDAVAKKQVVVDYETVIQNLRLVRDPARNAWARQAKAWSEAAIAVDGEGRILFLFSRSPFSMWEFNERVIALPLDIRRAMHVEGGPEASLSIHAGGVGLDLCGSFETGFVLDDKNVRQWPIPNVLGVAQAGKE